MFLLALFFRSLILNTAGSPRKDLLCLVELHRYLFLHTVIVLLQDHLRIVLLDLLQTVRYLIPIRAFWKHMVYQVYYRSASSHELLGMPRTADRAHASFFRLTRFGLCFSMACLDLHLPWMVFQLHLHASSHEPTCENLNLNVQKACSHETLLCPSTTPS